MEEKKLSRYFFIAVLIATTLLFFRMVRIFLVPILLAAVFSTLFYPLYEAFLRIFRGRKTLASFFCCFILLLGLMVPLYVVADLVAREAIEFYRASQDQIPKFFQKGAAGPLGWLRTLPLVRDLPLEQIDLKGALQNLLASASGMATALIRKTSQGTIQVVFLLFTTLFTMFYFFRDGRDLLRRVRALIPLDREYKNAIAARFTAVARATVKGTLLIALVQGTLSGITLWIFGVGSPFLWGVVATLAAIVPMVGAWLVLYPAAFIQITTGHTWQGIGIVLVTVLVIVNVDNVMRPRLVGQETGMHDLMVFFSTLGGIAMFGPTGFIVGPMIAALFLSLLDIYSADFRETLEAAPAPASGSAALPELEPSAARGERVPRPDGEPAETSPPDPLSSEAGEGERRRTG
ncbi:MAG TPA: AI-2E family transporter [Thermoanaerobaculia bacterium]|jgi:predicted PurR-regulated permease PerM|nr:AI-2E family transporter [Thermoanaerobaculia bacterium]